MEQIIAKIKEQIIKEEINRLIDSMKLMGISKNDTLESLIREWEAK